MAKALLGHVSLGPDLHLLAEVRRLRQRVRDLEGEVSRLRATNAALLESVTVEDSDLYAMPAQEPALT
jgi:hypothetical protein